MLQRAFVRIIQDLLAWDALLALALLHQKVLATVTLVGKLAASGAPKTLFCAAMRLDSWHVARKGNGEMRESKELYLLGRRITMK
jgi:hypothetical protein